MCVCEREREAGGGRLFIYPNFLFLDSKTTENHELVFILTRNCHFLNFIMKPSSTGGQLETQSRFLLEAVSTLPYYIHTSVGLFS